VRTWPSRDDGPALVEARRQLGDEATALLVGARTGGVDDPDEPVEVETFVDCRYAGQSHELTVDDVAAFHHEHQRRNGYARADAAVEVTAIRARARRPSPVRSADLPVVERSAAVGPTVIAEPDCTIWVPAGWRADPGAAGALVLTRVVP